MSVLLETALGDVVIDLDVEGSPILCRNFLKLCKARYYTQSLIHHVVPNRFVVLGDPTGTGKGGASFFGILSQANHHEDTDPTRTTTRTTTTRTTPTPCEEEMKNRFLSSSSGRRLTQEECKEKGRVVALELYGLQDTVGSQFLITTTSGTDRALDGFQFIPTEQKQQQQHQKPSRVAYGFLSLGKVVEDESNLLDRWADCYADHHGRPYADWRVQRALVVYDPFDDPNAIRTLMRQRGVVFDDKGDENDVIRSPDPERPPEETVTVRIPIQEVVHNITGSEEDGAFVDPIKEREFLKEIQRKEDRSRAVVLELLGDLPDADIKAPENVLFLCKLNSVTTDEDLQLILSRFDEQVSVEIVRDQETGQSLNYAFAEFTTPAQATQAYLKMNQALVDDRRIVVDFSQSVAKLWDRHRQRFRNNNNTTQPQRQPRIDNKSSSSLQHGTRVSRPLPRDDNRQPPYRDNRGSYHNRPPYRRDNNNKGAYQDKPPSSWDHDDRGPARNDDREPYRNDDREPYRNDDDRAPNWDSRAPYRDNRGTARDSRGPYHSDRAPNRDNNRGTARDDNRGPYHDDRGTARDDNRGPYRHDRGTARDDDRRPNRDSRVATRDDRGVPTRDNRAPYHEDRAPTRDNRPPPRDKQGRPQPVDHRSQDSSRDRTRDPKRSRLY